MATSCSRAESLRKAALACSSAADSVRILASRFTAFSIASRSLSGVTGFERKSSAPSFIVFTAMSMSPWAEMKMMGSVSPRNFISCWSSIPLMPGMRTSSTRHPGVKGLSFSRNSSALAYVSTFQPSPSITNCQERLTSGSSSTTRTIALDCVFAVIVSPFFGFVVFAENHCSQCGRPEGRKTARNHTPRAQERNSENVQNGA